MWHRRGAGRLERRRVLVHTKDGQTFGGILVAAYADVIVLRAGKPRAPLVTYNGDDVVELGGEVWVERENVSFYQPDGVS